MKFLTLIFAVLLSSEIGFGAGSMSLEQAMDLQEQITLSPVTYQGLPVISAIHNSNNMPAMVCASLGYSRLVAFEVNSEKTVREFLKNGVSQVAAIKPAGNDSEGYTHSHGAYFFYQEDLSKTLFKGVKLTTLKSVTCAKGL